MRSRVTVLWCATALLGSVLLGCGSKAAAPSCEAGAQVHRLGMRSVTLACGETAAGRELRLYSFQDAGGPCVVLAGLPGGTRGCGRAPSERVPASSAAIGGPAIVRRF